MLARTAIAHPSRFSAEGAQPDDWAPPMGLRGDVGAGDGVRRAGRTARADVDGVQPRQRAHPHDGPTVLHEQLRHAVMREVDRVVDRLQSNNVLTCKNPRTCRVDQELEVLRRHQRGQRQDRRVGTRAGHDARERVLPVVDVLGTHATLRHPGVDHAVGQTDTVEAGPAAEVLTEQGLEPVREDDFQRRRLRQPQAVADVDHGHLDRAQDLRDDAQVAGPRVNRGDRDSRAGARHDSAMISRFWKCAYVAIAPRTNVSTNSGYARFWRIDPVRHSALTLSRSSTNGGHGISRQVFTVSAMTWASVSSEKPVPVPKIASNSMPWLCRIPPRRATTSGTDSRPSVEI